MVEHSLPFDSPPTRRDRDPKVESSLVLVLENEDTVIIHRDESIITVSRLYKASGLPEAGSPKPRESHYHELPRIPVMRSSYI